MTRALWACALGAALAASPARAAEQAPPWLIEAQQWTLPSNPRIPAVVLLDEARVEVRPDGRTVTNGRYAVRVLTREGRDAAIKSVVYLTDAGKVRDMRAWLVRPSGEVLRYGADRVLDLAAAGNDIYNEVRIRAIGAVDDAEPGATFGCEWTAEERPLFPQLEHRFQSGLPSRTSRLALTLPPGWRTEAVTFNHAPIAPAVAGATTTWELADLPFIEDEPASPPLTDLAPRVIVAYVPPAGGPALPRFSSWMDVSAWLAGLSDAQAAPDAALTARARQLTAGGATPLERTRAIARFVQALPYVSIQTGLGRGGGYRPHAATEVLAKSYGDCKDKANLMKALLGAVDVPAWLVSIYSSDRNYVREDWPSPQQFNHCILAVRAADPKTRGPIVTHPTLGPLLLFDPTDPHTPLGDLPEDEQGSLALVIAGDAGALLRVPRTPPESNRLERTAQVTLAADGSIQTTLRERSTGNAAVDERRLHAGSSGAEYRKTIERWVSRGVTGAVVEDVAAVDDPEHGRFALDVRFTAPRYAQRVQGDLLVLRPALVGRRNAVFPTDAGRTHPVVLEAEAWAETVTVALPEAFEVDELPEPAKLSTGFGSFETSYAKEAGMLRATRRLVLQPSRLPVEQYAAVREFFEKVRAADQAAVVLAKK